MIEQSYDDIAMSELLQGVIDNNGWPGFFKDYRILHSLIRKYKPKSFCEIGTCDGSGTMIIKNAIGKDAVVFSLDLPTEFIQQSLRMNGGDKVGKACTLPFVQLRGDSMTFDFYKYPCEGYFVDGAHDFVHVFRETTEILKLKPIIVIFHDSDILEVFNAIMDAKTSEYELYRVIETRVSYLLKKEK